MSYLTRLNTLLTSTTSRYDSLRRNILSSSSSEDDTGITDPSTSHVSRVLRAYYTEKNRPFPEWLGVDPRSPATSASAQSQIQIQTARPGMGWGNVSEGRSGSGGLGEIWNDGTGNSNSNAEEGMGRGSLRRGPVGARRQGMGMEQGGGKEQGEGLNVRPLPSQRVGSYQSVSTTGGGGGGAAERLKARLNRGGSGSGGGEGGGQGGSYATQGLSGWQGQGQGRR